MSSDSKKDTNYLWTGTIEHFAELSVEHKIAEGRMHAVHAFLLKQEKNDEAAVITHAIQIMSRYTDQTRACLVNEIIKTNQGREKRAEQPEPSPAPSSDIVQ